MDSFRCLIPASEMGGEAVEDVDIALVQAGDIQRGGPVHAEEIVRGDAEDARTCFLAALCLERLLFRDGPVFCMDVTGTQGCSAYGCRDEGAAAGGCQ